MNVKHISLIALCTMASSIVAMEVNPTYLPINPGKSAKGGLEQDQLLNDARLLATHLGCVESKCIEDALTLINDNHKEMIELDDDYEIDDDFADSDDNETICQWSSEPPNY
jgi:hypothetical protein